MARPLEGFILDTREYDETLKKYIKLTSKTVAEAANSMAYYVARNAVATTIRADKNKMERHLGRYIKVTGPNKKGVVRTRRQMSFAKMKNNTGATRAFLIINARRAKRGLPPLTGSKMRTAAKKMIMARIRSINFVRSAWLPAIKKLAKWVRIGRMGKGANEDSNFAKIEGEVRVKGKEKGDARPAYPQESMLEATAIIVNSVGGGRPFGGQKGKNSTFVQEEKMKGLKLAIEQEMRSKMLYIEKKLKEDVKMVTHKTTGVYTT